MKIVSWNMNHWLRTSDQRKEAWQYLKGLKADYALLQETSPPREWRSDRFVFQKLSTRGSQWGSAVVSFADPIHEVSEWISPHGKKKHNLRPAIPGTLAVARSSRGVLLVSGYGLIDNGYAVTTVHKLLSDLTPLFDSKLGRRVVLAGDLNVSTQFSEPDRRRHRNLLERFETLGLVDCLGLDRPRRKPIQNCHCGDTTCKHIHTHRHKKSPKPWQNDYMFISKSLESSVLSCRAINEQDSPAWKLSDHCPLELVLNIPPRGTSDISG